MKRCTLLTMMLVSVFFAGCETLQNSFVLPKPTFQLTGLKFADATLDSATLLFDVEVDNPYSVALPLLNLDYDLASGDVPFLKGNAPLQSTIPAKSKKTVSLPATINYMDMLKSLKGIRPGAKIPYKANLGLSVDAPVLGAMKLPLKKQGELALPEINEANIRKIWDVIKPK